MSPLALGLVLIAAFTHATWNYAAKRAGGGLPFVWISSIIALGLYLVVGTAYWLWRQPVLPAGVWWIVAGSGLLKTAYSLLLQRAYRHGEFSLVYPLTRGTAPLLATLAAMAVFGERPTAPALAGGGIIVASIFHLTGGTALLHTDRAHLRQGVWLGLACGTCVAVYTVWDQRAMSHLQLPPVLYDGGTQLVLFSVLTPFAWARRGGGGLAPSPGQGRHRRPAQSGRLCAHPDGHVLHAGQLHRPGPRDQHRHRRIFRRAIAQGSRRPAPLARRRRHGVRHHRAGLGLNIDFGFPELRRAVCFGFFGEAFVHVFFIFRATTIARICSVRPATIFSAPTEH